MYSFKSILAFIAWLTGSAVLFWAMLITQLPWDPGSMFEAIAIPGSVFGFGLIALGGSWLLMRSGRSEVVPDDPLRWRWTERALVCQASIFAAAFFLLVVSTFTH